MSNPLQSTIEKLDAPTRRAVNIDLCKTALERWNHFAKTCKPRYLSYIEHVVGTAQLVDTRLPADAYSAAILGRDHVSAEKRYLEPMTAIVDLDWELPEEIAYAYLSIHNLFQRYALNDETVEEWVITNQALASMGDLEKSRHRLEDAINRARNTPSS